MNYCIMILAKIARNILKLWKRGTSYPGYLALKLNKNILNFFELPKTTIFVTGTTGKTTVSSTIHEIYQNAGYKTVSNIKGSNLLAGITSTIIEGSKINGKPKCDVLIVEIDERYVKEAFKYITPKYFIINNLSRDQLARNGHYELVFNEINAAIKEETHLILNGDDPLVTKFGINKKNPITYYGVGENKYSTKENKINTLDQAYCPVCHEKLTFNYFNYGNLGDYACPNDDYKRPQIDYEGILKDDELIIEDNLINLENTALYNVYNLVCCYCLCKTDNIPSSSITNTLNNLSLKVKRLNEFTLNGVKGTILLSKNETPISYNGSLEYVASKDEEKTVVIGFTRVSGRYDLKDLSWLYDINFELLNNKTVQKIILVGPFMYDIATRLKLAGIPTTKFVYCKDYKNSLDFSIKEALGNLYFVVYFDLDYQYLDELKERGVS